MALSNEDMARLTLADLEAVAARFAGAVATIREAQALLGGGVAAPVAHVPAPVAPARPVAAQVISPEQQAELDSWRRSPARAKLLEQFKDEPVGVEP